MSKYEIGEHVLIIEDCRRDAQEIATGQTGIYEGHYDLETGQPDAIFGNPRIRLQDGSVIWGIECWWTPVRKAGPLPQEQEALEEHKAFLREVYAMGDE